MDSKQDLIANLLLMIGLIISAHQSGRSLLSPAIRLGNWGWPAAGLMASAMSCGGLQHATGMTAQATVCLLALIWIGGLSSGLFRANRQSRA